jgi:tetratricopeptide (TPR) repeat protein
MLRPMRRCAADAYQRLGLLYTEKVENSVKAIDAWQKLLQIDDNNRRAQDALKKLYITEGRWDELEQFYASRQQGRRVHPRARARGRVGAVKRIASRSR